MRKGSCSEGSLQLGLWMAFRLTLVVSFVACQCMCNEGALPLERLAWKVFQLYRLSQASQVQPLGYGAGILFSTLSTDQLQLPARLSAYVAAFRALRPHRLQSVHAMRLERTALLQHADFSACRQLSYHQQCLPCCTCRISDASAKAPYAFSGHHQGSSPTTFTAATATTAAGTGAAFNFVGTSSSMARRCQLSPSSHLVSSSLGLRQAARSRCSDRPAATEGTTACRAAAPELGCHRGLIVM